MIASIVMLHFVKPSMPQAQYQQGKNCFDLTYCVELLQVTLNSMQLLLLFRTAKVAST